LLPEEGNPVSLTAGIIFRESSLMTIQVSSFQLPALQADSQILEILPHKRYECNPVGKIVPAYVMGAVE
jgi:hypothetical protein